jgi:hypothetical protein
MPIAKTTKAKSGMLVSYRALPRNQEPGGKADAETFPRHFVFHSAIRK